jgi:formamidopyrimidine-DNA glycosylase
VPELPEVETTVKELNKKVLGRTFIDTWSDYKKQIQRPKSFSQFKKQIRGKKIKKVRRRGKNIIFDLSETRSLLIHQKLTGHLLVGYWISDNRCWKPKIKGPLGEKVNTYIHLLFTFDDGKMLALSDLRKFGKVELWDTKELEKSEQIKNLGPEPLEKSFTFKKFLEILKEKRGKIKQVLMDQKIIAGIGNIYSDEILWRAKIHPEKDTFILKLALRLGGTSISDYRRSSGGRGYYGEKRKVYRREGKKCPRCGEKIKRIKISGRSAHFCPKCQRA